MKWYSKFEDKAAIFYDTYLPVRPINRDSASRAFLTLAHGPFFRTTLQNPGKELPR